MLATIKLFAQDTYLTNYWNAKPGKGVVWSRENQGGKIIKVGKTVYSILRNNNQQWQLLEHPTGKYESDHSQVIWSICDNSTSFCCGIWQLGSFFCRKDIPKKLADKFIKIIASNSKYNMRKGVMQAYFYKARGHDNYEHEFIRQAFIRNGFTENTPETYNPNSGNKIKGYYVQLITGARTSTPATTAQLATTPEVATNGNS